MTPTVSFVTLHPETPARVYWDQTLLEWALRIAGFDDVGDGPADLMVVPGRMNWDREADLAPLLAGARTVVVTSDEEARFDIATAAPDAEHWWVQMPGIDVRDDDRHRTLPLGPAPHPWQPQPDAGRTFDWCFAGQVTHDRRRAAISACQAVPHGLLLASDRFAHGVPYDVYGGLLGRSRLVPCPSGPVHVETFRMYEALESGCLPVLDGRTSDGRDWHGWWESRGMGLPVVADWAEFPDLAPGLLDDWQHKANLAGAAWLNAKHDLAARLWADAGGEPPQVTTVVTMSPIPSHPSLHVLTETLASLREFGPPGPVIVACDGWRDASCGVSRDDYQEAVRSLLSQANAGTIGVDVIVADGWEHQANMLRRALDRTRSPLVFPVEHDTPLIGPVPWDLLASVVLSGEANAIRLHHETHVHEEHRMLFVGDGPTGEHGVPLWRTMQFSFRPHLASTAWYRQMLADWFPHETRGFVEDKLYGVITDRPWEWSKMFMYCPNDSGSLGYKRSTHTDGRAGAEKSPAFC